MSGCWIQLYVGLSATLGSNSPLRYHVENLHCPDVSTWNYEGIEIYMRGYVELLEERLSRCEQTELLHLQSKLVPNTKLGITVWNGMQACSGLGVGPESSH